MKIARSLLLALLCSASLFAQDAVETENYDEYLNTEAQSYKRGGVAMLIGGTAMIGGGIAMVANDRSDGGAKAMGYSLIGVGTGLDIGGIIMLVKGKEISESKAPVSLMVGPGLVTFVSRF